MMKPSHNGSAKQPYAPTRFMLPSSHYEKRRADRAVSFIQSLKHTKGVWSGKPFLLFPWQEQIIRDLFGTIKESGYRQFNTSFVEICKKAGKSELAAAVALYMLCADNEEGAEIYGCANDRQQAAIVFNVARDMVLQSPLLLERIKIVESQKRLVYMPTRSIYQALSSDVASKYGYNVHACIFDELLGQPNRKLYDVMTKGSGAARKQPLNFVITTAGSDKNSICYEVHAKAVDLLEGRKKDATFYPVVYSAPENADWTDSKVWKKANPSLGRTVDIEYYQQRCESAKENPAEEIQFRQFHLCQWTNTTVRWMPMDKWDACRSNFTMDDLEGRGCYAGLDLSSTSDLTALALVFPPEGESDPYYVVPFFWLPKETLDLRVRRDHVMYDIWEKQGFIHTTEGNVVHYGFIERFIVELGERFNIREIAYDRWNASMMVQTLQDDGFTMIPFGQGFRDMSNPTKDLMRLVLDKSLLQNGHPVLRWNIDNIHVRTDPAGNLKIDKEKSTEKVDGAVALVMALDRAMKNQGGGSVYDTDRGLLFI
ncbi:MAG: terminase TerL endonuclease subunit [Clostridia bacterium]